MKLKNLLLMITLIFMLGCSASYQSVMDDVATKHNSPEETYHALKEAEVDDEGEAIKLQASVSSLALRLPSASFKDESQKLLNIAEDIDISALDTHTQAILYLAMLANDDSTRDYKIEFNIRSAINALCVPSNTLAYQIDDIEKFSDAFYSYHIAQACKAALVDDSPIIARHISLAILVRQEEGCNFTPKTHSKLYISELMQCRLKRHGIDLTTLLPKQEVH